MYSCSPADPSVAVTSCSKGVSQRPVQSSPTGGAPNAGVFWGISSPSCSTSSDEQDPYPAKLQELQQQIQLLENQCHKTSAKTSGGSSCHKDTSENTRLKQKVEKLEVALSKCRSKLVALGEPVSVSLSLDEQFHKNTLSPLSGYKPTENTFPVPAKQILGDLQPINMSKSTEKAQEELFQLREQVRLYQQSPSEKDAEIRRLQNLVSQMQVSTTVKEMELKQKLSTLSALCQDVASKLSQGSTPSSSVVDIVPTMQKKLQIGSSTEVKRLEEELQKVVEMNTRWQKYNEQRETYIKQVQEKMKQLEQSREQISGPTSGLNEEQAAQIDKMILEQKQHVEAKKKKVPTATLR